MLVEDHGAGRSLVRAATRIRLSAAGTALVLWFGAQRVLEGRLTVGELIVVTTYIASVYQPLEAISTTFTSMREKMIGLRSALALLDQVPEVRQAPDATDLPRAA